MFCKKCGAQIADDSQFCPKCGQAVNETAPENAAPTEPTTADKVQGGIQGIGLIVSTIMIIVAIGALMGTCS